MQNLNYSEILKQLTDMMANVEDMIERENRTKLLEVFVSFI